jgi:hypothetical protein
MEWNIMIVIAKARPIFSRPVHTRIQYPPCTCTYISAVEYDIRSFFCSGLCAFWVDVFLVCLAVSVW